MEETPDNPMKSCGDVRRQVPFYLDDELRDRDLDGFESHVAACRACREVLDAERSFVDLVRTDGGIEAAPSSLRSEVGQILEAISPPLRASSSLNRRVRRLVLVPRTEPVWRRYVAVAAAASLALVVFSMMWQAPHSGPVAPSEFAIMAVATHQRHQRGGLPLEIETGSADAVKRWFADKVPFLLELPTYQEYSGQDRLYGIVGARLVGYRGDYAAFVAYEMASRPISLIVTSTSLAAPAGGQTVVSKGLTFHFDTVDGLKVITWSHRGLTYALVSDLEERGEASCKVCHAGTQDQDFLIGLREE